MAHDGVADQVVRLEQDTALWWSTCDNGSKGGGSSYSCNEVLKLVFTCTFEQWQNFIWSQSCTLC